MSKQIMNARDIMDEFEVSRAQAYRIIKLLNEELAEKGYLTITGKVSRKFVLEKFYGFTENTQKGGAA